MYFSYYLFRRQAYVLLFITQVMPKKNNKYHIITIGCQMNKSDSERISGHLEENGFKQTDKRKQADLLVINTCGVRQSAEDRVYGLVGKIRGENKKVKIVVTGCLSEREDVQKRLKDQVDIWLPIRDISNLLNKERNSESCDYLKIAPKYKSRISAFVPIGNGCNNYCAYCVVPYARGREVYRPAEEVLAEVCELVNKGYKEIVLIAQNVNSYLSNKDRPKSTGSLRQPASRLPQDDNGVVNFAKLLRMVNDVPGEFWVRFATSHPKDMSDELIKAIAECDKACEHVHLPVQAGDDEVLKRMNRGYTRGDYVKLVKCIREVINSTSLRPTPLPVPPLIRGGCLSKMRTGGVRRGDGGEVWKLPVAITTDIIVGFPGETKKQFSNTVKLFKEVKFDMAYIAQYSPRPGTAAAKLKDDVPKAEKKRREEELMKVLRETALENNKQYVGKTVEVLVEGCGKDEKFWGKTRTGKVVKLRMKNEECKIGEFVDVEIKKALQF